jgi:ERCC4-related helicase
MQLRKRLSAMEACGAGEPKLRELTRLLQQHFQAAQADGVHESRAIVFTSLRNGVAGICEALNNLEGDLISARCGLEHAHT